MMALADAVHVSNMRAASCSDLQDDASSSTQSEGEMLSYGLQSRSEMDLAQGKDSGIDCSSDTSLPDDETTQKILKTVEYYFSDVNIVKDNFLLKHVRRNKDGYVSLKLVSSFRKVRSLCRNWKAVAESLKKSDMLALNSEGTKVRRLNPLPPECEKVPSKTVIVYGIPGTKLSVETFSEMFSKCGEIALVRVLRFGSSTSADIKKVLSKNPDIKAKGCGLIEFEDIDGARQALAMDTGKENGMRVVPVGNAAGKDDKTATSDETKQNSPKKKRKARRSAHGSKTELKDALDNEHPKSKGYNPRRSSSGSLGNGSSNSSGYLSSSPADTWYLRRHSYNVPCASHAEPTTTSSSFASLKNRGHYKGSKDRLGKKGNDVEKPTEPAGSQSPWRLRRELMRNELSSSCLNMSVPLVRHPKGPDGSRGFQFRARQELPPTAE